MKGVVIQTGFLAKDEFLGLSNSVRLTPAGLQMLFEEFHESRERLRVANLIPFSLALFFGCSSRGATSPSLVQRIAHEFQLSCRPLARAQIGLLIP
jgi:hypothetical protein